MPGIAGVQEAIGAQRQKYLDGWAAQMIKTASIPFDKIGALQFGKTGETIVGAFTDTRETLNTCSLSTMGHSEHSRSDIGSTSATYSGL
jgi:hypothetical protein